MAKTVHSDAEAHLRALLRDARRRAGLTREQTAAKLGQHQSFVARYEGGERRIDVVEFVRIARVLGADPLKLFRSVLERVR
jgi:transcriptional regulator with XRE-family HTH domain